MHARVIYETCVYKNALIANNLTLDVFAAQPHVTQSKSLSKTYSFLLPGILTAVHLS
jgi:hypothetical protein